jgi:hypothetical protein
MREGGFLSVLSGSPTDDCSPRSGPWGNSPIHRPRDPAANRANFPSGRPATGGCRLSTGMLTSAEPARRSSFSMQKSRQHKPYPVTAGASTGPARGHAPKPHRHLVRYFGWCSNQARDRRARAARSGVGEDDSRPVKKTATAWHEFETHGIVRRTTNGPLSRSGLSND